MASFHGLRRAVMFSAPKSILRRSHPTILRQATTTIPKALVGSTLPLFSTITASSCPLLNVNMNLVDIMGFGNFDDGS